MTIARVQATGANNGFGGFGTVAATFPGAVTAGNLLVCFYEGASNLGNPTCADNINGSWTALTTFSNIPSSTKRYTFFYKLATASASAGSMTVTVTPNANTGTTEIIQIAEYSGVASYDAACAANGTLTSGTGPFLASGVPTQSGNLILAGFASNTNTNKTFTATSGVTAMVFDGTGKSGGESGGAQTMAFAELIGAGSGSVTATLGIGTTDNGGMTVIGFAPSTAAILTKTQTATARIANTRTKTQSAISRIANIRTKTQAGISRIANSRTKTQSAVASISPSFVKSQTAVARIARSVSKTQSAIARIGGGNTKTQSAIARISNRRTLTQSGTARIYQTQYVLHPPTTDGPAFGTDRFWRRIRPIKVGLTIIKENGAYRTVETPSQDEINAAEVVYLGGRSHYVSAAEATALTSAGYTVEAM